MMFACGYFLYTEGLWSYASFAAIEVIIISSLAAALILLDAISAFRCKSPAGAKQDGNKVITGADYESEDDDEGKRIRKNKKWQDVAPDEFGGNDSMRPLQDAGVQIDTVIREPSRHELSLGEVRLNEETKRQIIMLEELAR